MRRIIAASIGYIDPASSPQSGTLYVSTESFTTDSGDTPASTWFDGRLTGDIDFNFQVRAPFTGYDPRTGFGKLTLSNADGALDALIEYELRDQPVVIKSLEPGQDWSAGTVLATCLADKVVGDGLENIVIDLRDPTALLDTPLAQKVWSTANFPDADGKIRPVAFGTPLNCKPIPVIFDDNRFDVAEGAIVDIADVRVNGVSVPFSTVGGGVSSGFTLESQPDGEVLCDVIATGTENILTIVQDSPLAAGIGYSNNGRTVQNKNRTYDSPQVNVRFTTYVNNSKLLSAGGKYYFEATVNKSSQTLFGFTPHQYGTAVGIAASAPTSTQDPNQADQYSLLTCHDGGSARVVTYRDTSTADSFQNPSLFGGSWEDVTVGVEVDFDAATVVFKAYDSTGLAWTSSTIAITQNSPLDAFLPMVAVTGTPNADLRTQDNKITINLQPEYFQRPVPSGFEAWGESAYSASTQFSDLVASITDRISGLTIDTTTEAEIDALGYSYSYFVDDATPAAQVLFNACASFGGWYYITRTGSVAFGQLKEPLGTGVATFTDAELISIRELAVDYAPGLSNRMGALRNWSASRRDSLDDSLTESEKDLYSRRFRHEAVSTVTPADIYSTSTGAEIAPTLFRTAADANAEVDRLLDLFTMQRKFIDVDVAFDLDQYTNIKLGSSVAVSFSRYGLGNAAAAGAYSLGFDDGFDIGAEGRTYLVLGIAGNFSSSRMRLLLWG